jgi:bifunctional non-homologous end joining protein LigD
LLKINAKDIRVKPYLERKERLARLLEKHRNDRIRYVDHFDNPNTLLEACSGLKLEGIVSKRADGRYISGSTRSWIKVKCDAWRDANKWRQELFAAPAWWQASSPSTSRRSVD